MHCSMAAVDSRPQVVITGLRQVDACCLDALGLGTDSVFVRFVQQLLCREVARTGDVMHANLSRGWGHRRGSGGLRGHHDLWC